jgi:hypothetical protein
MGGKILGISIIGASSWTICLDALFLESESFSLPPNNWSSAFKEEKGYKSNAEAVSMNILCFNFIILYI